MSPSWYDILGVDRDAHRDEVRAAWRRQIADLEPGERRFVTLNQAAEVLLDDERRAAYDASLEPEPTPEPQQAPVLDVETESGAPDEPTPAPAPRRRWGTAALAGLAAVLVAAVAALGLTAWFDAAAAGEADAARQARAAAEEAVVPILSYDHRTLEADRATAVGYLTPRYREEYEETFGLVAQNAPGLKTVVEAELVDSGVVRTGDGRVQVLVFVDQETTNKQTSEPLVYQNHVVVTMQQVDGEWLVDDLRTQG